MSAKRQVAVVNPHSANGRTGRSWAEVQRAIEGEAGPVETLFTHGPLEATALTRRALQEGCDEVLCVGGDGTVNEVVNGFFVDGSPINTQAILTVVPSGTGGDFRKTIGIGPSPMEALELLRRGTVRPADVGSVRCTGWDGQPVERMFMNILSFGIGGLIDDAVNHTTKALGGKASFFIGSMKAMFKYRNQPVRLELDGAPAYEGPICSVNVCNGQYFGGGMWVAPMASPFDGAFEIVIMGDLSKPAFAALSRTIYAGKHLGHAKVTHLRGTTLKATTSGDALIDMDGETPGRLPLEIRLLPGALRLRTLGAGA
jgi:YegS/Rv2252/BmrU family lipid kinase